MTQAQEGISVIQMQEIGYRTFVFGRQIQIRSQSIVDEVFGGTKGGHNLLNLCQKEHVVYVSYFTPSYCEA